MPNKPPPGYSLEDVPDFLKPTAATANVVTHPADPNYAGDVKITSPHTINVYGDQGQPVIDHEMEHVFDDSRSLGAMAGTLWDTLKGKVNSSYDYGGVDGLLAAQSQGKTIANFGPEQRANMVADFQQQTQDAIKRGDGAALDKINRAYGPLVRQLAALPPRGDSSPMNVTPADPGLPPAMETGILAPDKLLGGQARVLKNPPKVPKGYTLEK